MSASSQSRLSVREAALAAAQARLNPPPSYDSSSTYASNPAVTGGVVPQAATNGGSSVAEQAPFSPGSRASPRPALTDKEEKELKLKFGKLLNRGIVRDNGYKESAEAVEVGLILDIRRSRVYCLKEVLIKGISRHCWRLLTIFFRAMILSTESWRPPMACCRRKFCQWKAAMTISLL